VAISGATNGTFSNPTCGTNGAAYGLINGTDDCVRFSFTAWKGNQAWANVGGGSSAGGSTSTNAPPCAGFPGNTTGGYKTVCYQNTYAVTSGTYASGITATGTTGQTCTLNITGTNMTGIGTVALTGTNTIASGTAIAININTGGNGFTSAPASATAGNGTATCSGTAAISTTTAPAPLNRYSQNVYYCRNPAGCTTAGDWTQINNSASTLDGGSQDTDGTMWDYTIPNSAYFLVDQKNQALLNYILYILNNPQRGYQAAGWGFWEDIDLAEGLQINGFSWIPWVWGAASKFLSPLRRLRFSINYWL
jgi:hypothetical protein